MWVLNVKMAVEFRAADEHEHSKGPRLHHQVVVVQSALAVDGGKEKRCPAKGCPVGGEDGPHAEDGGDGAEVSLGHCKRGIQGAKHFAPLAADELRIDREQQ